MGSSNVTHIGVTTEKMGCHDHIYPEHADMIYKFSFPVILDFLECIKMFITFFLVLLLTTTKNYKKKGIVHTMLLSFIESSVKCRATFTIVVLSEKLM